MKTFQFPNGFRFIYEKPNSDIPVTSILGFVKLGSIHERDGIRGVSHFIEHMCFKGTKRHPTSKIISRNYDRIGAYFNAYTHKEYTCYEIKCEEQYLENSIHVLSDMMMNSQFNKKEFEKTLRPLGLRARWLENIQIWLDAIARAVELPESKWPAMRTNADTLPPIKLWRDKFPEKFAPLSHARAAIEKIALENSIPIENLITPEIVRRICWAPPASATTHRSLDAVVEFLAKLGARNWQIDLVAGAIADALLEKEPIPSPDPVPETTPEEA
jgi:hypothetical protein